MEASSEQFKEELDRLKSKYRKEALRAVAAADADGYARGIQEVKEAAEKKIAQWKAIAEAVTSNHNGTSKPVLLVHHIVEQLYRDIKHEYPKDTEITLAKLKGTLLLSSSKLIESMPEIVLSSTVTHETTDKPSLTFENTSKLCSCNCVCAVHGIKESSLKSQKQVPDAHEPAQASAVQTCDFDMSLSRVLHRAHPPRYFIKVGIDKVVDNVVKGVFIDGQYVSYHVNVKVKQLDYAKRAGSTIGGASYSFERRNSDMKNLYQQLLKDHPRSMVPPVPTKHYKIFARARQCKLKKDQVKMYYRKRMFPLWLQYMANTEQGQEAHTLVTFLTGLFSFESLQAEAAAATQSTGRQVSVGEVNQAIIHQRSFALFEQDQTQEVVQMKNAIGGFITSTPTLEPVPSSTTQRAIPFDQAYTINNKYLSHYRNLTERNDKHNTEEVESATGESWGTIALQVFPMQRLAYRDLRTVDRDLTQLEPVASTAIAACRALLDSWCDFSAELDSLGEEIAAWGRIEPPESVEFTLIDAVTVAAGQTNPLMANIGESLQCGLFEPVEFLQGSCLQTARDSVDYVLKNYPQASFLPEKPYFRVPSERATTGDARAPPPGIAPTVGVPGMTGVGSGAGAALSSLTGVGDLVAVNKAKEGVAMATSTARCWDSCKRVRGAMLTQQMLVTARAIAAEHKQAKEFWQQAAEKLRIVNVTTHDADAWGGPGLIGPQNVAPALEESNSSLKAAIQEEIIGYSTHAMESRERFRSSDLTHQHNAHSETHSPSEPYTPLFPHPPATPLPGIAAEDSNHPQPQPQPPSEPRPSNARTQSTAVAHQSKGFAALTSLKSFRAIFSRAMVPFGKRRQPSVSRPSLPPQALARPTPVPAPAPAITHPETISEEEQLVQQYEAEAAAKSERENAPSGRLPPRRRSNQQPVADSTADHGVAGTPAKPTSGQLSSTSGSHKTSRSGQASEALLSAAGSTSSLSSLDATPHSQSHGGHGAAGESGAQDDLLQQDQRQHRVAARRGLGHGHATSKIKASGPLLAPSHTPDAFGAAPQPAATLHTHAVYTSNSPTTLPSEIPHARSGSQKSATSAGSNEVHAAHRAPEPPAQFPSPTKQPEEELKRSTSVSPVNSMPSGWIEVETEDGGVYYYHSITRVSRWDRPNEEVAAALEARIQQANSQVDEAVQKRKEELKREKQLQDDRDAQVAQLQSKVKHAVEQWMNPPGSRNGRDLAQLLCTLHTVVTYIPSAEAIWDISSSAAPVTLATAKPVEVKKAYLKAVRFVHPDKLPDDLSVEMELVAEAVFIALTDAYNKYRARIDAASS